MNYINLDPKFNPFGKESVDIKQFNFPSGCEPHIKLPLVKGNTIVTTRIKSSDDFIRLLLTIDALRRMRVENIMVFIPYLPFARQDRVMVEGEPLSVKVISNIINSLSLFNVTLYDVHSEVALALLDNSKVITNHDFVSAVLEDKTNYLIVSPDAGAYKKIFKLAQAINYTDTIVLSNKTRDVSNGNILSVTCDQEDFYGKDLYIIDDICDGGGTFVLLAEELKKRNCGKVNLIVSHGIFSKGIDALSNIDYIYTTNSFKDLDEHPKLSQIPLCIHS